MKLLLLSNSTNAGEPYLFWSRKEIKTFLGEKPVTALFIPYAAVSFSYDEYEMKVENRFAEWGHHVTSIHHAKYPVQAIEEAEAIVVGGGNTWQLVRKMHDLGLMQPVRKKAMEGTPYIGWSAGTNIACPTLQTTNDMPIVHPRDFNTLNLIPFQVNPHYIDAHPVGFSGETREVRIKEFIEINPNVSVLGLRESTLLKLENNRLQLIGWRTARLFQKNKAPRDLQVTDDLSFLLNDSPQAEN
ncbi:MAG: dipeptidase PepE [Dysgonamonadaceae bacterium]|jgi:dipeptidase E|nr:dipeptidase PepE [Dysgonamonadaceae bacterium]